mgnify:CR=1 FL=1
MLAIFNSGGTIACSKQRLKMCARSGAMSVQSSFTISGLNLSWPGDDFF